MEIALEPDIPTYSGGLGVLAGDTVRSAADLGIPLVAVTLLYRKGYFYQRIDESGGQIEEPVHWVMEDHLKELAQRVTVPIDNRVVSIRPWRYHVEGITGFIVPVYLLDTDLEENTEEDRRFTDHLYGGDQRYRLCQEVILGIGGVRMLEALGYRGIRRFHMNEGHAALLALELLEQRARKSGNRSVTAEDIEAVRRKCIFTTHTPVLAGHDQFPVELMSRTIGEAERRWDIDDVRVMGVLDRILGVPHKTSDLKELSHTDSPVNMTLLALNLSHYVNGVAKRHGEITRLMFAEYTIHSITNGVHGVTWTSDPFCRLYDQYIPGWRQDNLALRYALSIPADDIWNAHMEAKKALIDYVNRETNAGMGSDAFTIGFARRATAYKRGDLFVSDLERLWKIVDRTGQIQLVCAGKAHPKDQEGKDVIARIWHAKQVLEGAIKISYLPNYDMAMGKLITSGVDLWLNTPVPPLEASGTSGMKAALNGVPSLSILDGWWIEGWIEGITGWSVGEDLRDKQGICDSSKDAALLYEKLEKTIMPLFYRDRRAFVNVMLHCIALNGSFFNTHRMMQQYVMHAYFS